jgi:DNA replication and repair protein RecF
MITDLRLQHFRSYSDESFEFQPGVNIIVGPNGSGKTNLLEAILVLAAGGSYRAKDIELVQFEQPWARLDSHDDGGTLRTVKLVCEPQPDKQYELAGKTYQRLSLPNTLPVVLFEPNHLQLLSGSPDQRRAYLDDLLEQTTAGYGALRRHYRRALAQRNALLKQPNANQTLLFPWNLRLSELAGQIVRLRQELTDQLNDAIGPLYQKLAHSPAQVELFYGARWPANGYESSLLKRLELNIALDKQRGFTTVGPHREDLIVLFDGHTAVEVASRGETRTLVLGLKILELGRLEAVRDAAPLLLLDDVFSELDGARRHALTDYLAKYQTFITTTDADIVVQHFTETTHIIPTSK